MCSSRKERLINERKNRMPKKMNKIKQPKKENNAMSKEEFNDLISGLADEEISQVYDWLLNLRQNL